MRITTHGNDLLVTDQSLGLGALLMTLGVLFLVAALARISDGQFLSLATALYAMAGALCLRSGFPKLVATQLIVDPDKRLLITKRWSFAKTDIQRIPFDAVSGFSIEPEGQATRTELIIQTRRGPVSGSGGAKGARAAWEDVVAAIQTHMGR